MQRQDESKLIQRGRASIECNPEDVYSLYFDHAKAVRSWLIAYGAGVPAIILSRVELTVAVVASSIGQASLILLLTGALAIIINCSINMWAAWLRYQLLDEKESVFVFIKSKPITKNSAITKLTEWWYGQVGIEVSVHVLTFAAYVVATCLLYSAIIDDNRKKIVATQLSATGSTAKEEQTVMYPATTAATQAITQIITPTNKNQEVISAVK